MNLTNTKMLIALTLGILTMAGNFSLADVIYDESLSGDLSSDNTSPTMLTFIVGSNEVLGSTTNAPLDRDFWTITIGAGQQLDSVILQSHVTTEDQSFFAVAAGPQVTSVSDASVLLGNSLIGAGTGKQVGDDVLDDLGGADFGGTGFTGPLGAGQYTFWFQETTANTDYGFNFNVSAVPEPNSIIFLLGLSSLIGLRRRK